MAETETTTPQDDVLEVELPPELAQAVQEAPAETPAAEAVPAEEAGAPETVAAPIPAPEEEPAKAAKRPMVPKAALDEERARRKEYQRRYEEAERARQAYLAEVARARAEAEARARAQVRPDYDQMASLRDVAEAIRQETLSEVQQELAKRDMLILRERVRRSQAEFERDHSDYRDVLQRSGVLDDIRPGPTGEPKDPWLHRHIFLSDDPARTAYEYAQGRLATELKADAEVRGEARGRREMVRQLVRAAERPRGIGGLPGATTARTGITRSQIAGLSDAAKVRLKRERPDVWEWYLGGGG